MRSLDELEQLPFPPLSAFLEGEMPDVGPKSGRMSSAAPQAEGGKVMQSSKSGFSSSSSSNELEEPVEDEGGRLQARRKSVVP